MRFPVARSATLLAATILSACGGGGGGGGSSTSSACPVDIDSLSNGATRETADSVWRCTADNIPDFSFMFFRDGTGQSSAIGDYQWAETDCGVADVEGDVPQTISDISVNADKDKASFITEQSTGSASVSCESQSDRPEPRTGHVASYNLKSQKMIVRGGGVAFGDTRARLADTWTFNGSDWNQVSPPTVPPIASGQAMVYDADRQMNVLILGRRESDILQTWEFDGDDWKHAGLDAAPSQRTSFHIAYDSDRDVIVLFGGRGGSDNTGPLLYDTWEYDGNEWTKRVTPDGTQCSSSTSNSPCIYSGSMAAMTYDPPRGKTVLVGKSASSTSVRTYEWDGNNWMERSPAQEPGIPSFGAMAHDRARNVSVLVTPQIWEWDGTYWHDTEINTGRLGQTVVYSPKSMATVLFGGVSGGTQYNDVQRFDGATLK